MHPRALTLPITLLAVLALPFACAVSCRSATQITVDIRTHGFKCSELKRVSIAVSSNAPDAESDMDSGFVAAEVKSCDAEDRVGTLVITPSSESGAVLIAASYTDDRCRPPAYKGCIVARRAFTFVDHRSLDLPITLEVECKDVPCDAFTSCRSGTCVTSRTECDESNTTCTAEAEPVFTPTGQPIPPEGGIVPIGGVDGGDASPPTTNDAGDSGIVDSGSDGPIGNPGPSGNACPSSNVDGGPDCFEQGTWCCAYNPIGCATSFVPCQMAGFPRLNCTGRKHCASTEWCCAPPKSQNVFASGCGPGQGVDKGCGNANPESATLCNTDADCPASWSCTGIYLERNTPLLQRILYCVKP